jgi:hypothetical protein
MTNFAELKARQDAERLAKAAAKAKAKPKQTISDAKLIRSRHVGMRRKLTVADAQTITAALKQRLAKTRDDVMREEEEAKRQADVEGGEAQAQRSDAPLLASTPPASLMVPPGEDKDAFLSRQRDQEIIDRAMSAKVGAHLDLPEETVRIYRLLMAYSQPRAKGQGEFGWRYVDLGAVGSDVWLVLGIARPEPPLWGGWTVINPEPQPTAAQRLQANQILSRAIEQLREAGLVRDIGLFIEISLDGVP